MVTRTIVSSTDPSLSKVSKSEVPQFIKYNNQVFEIRYSELRNLGLQNLNQLIDQCIGLGLDPMPDFIADCSWCDHNQNNIENYFKGKSENVNHITNGCNYVSPIDIQVARSFQHRKKGTEILAIGQNCAFIDALVITLEKKGILNDYRTDKQFNFRPIEDFAQGVANPEEHQVKRPTLIQTISGYFKTNFLGQ